MTTKWSSQDLNLSEANSKIHAPFSFYSSNPKQWCLLICVCSYIWAQKDCFLKRVRRFCITRAWASLLPGKKFKRLCFQKPGAEFLRSVVWKDQGSKMEIEWRGLDLRDWGGGKDWHGAGGCPLLIPAWLHDSEVPGSVVGGGIHYLT